MCDKDAILMIVLPIECLVERSRKLNNSRLRPNKQLTYHVKTSIFHQTFWYFDAFGSLTVF